MRKISTWARRHIMLTRLLIGLLYIAINLLGLFLGDLLFSADIVLTVLFIYFPIGLLFTGVLIYPSKVRKHSYKNFYRQQKTADLLLVVSTFLFIVYGGNSLNRNSYSSLSAANATAFSIPLNQLVNTASSIGSKETTTISKKPLSKKELKKKLKSKWKEFRKHYKESTKGEKTALIILSVIIAAGLLLLLAGLSCEISCSGAEGAAIAVGILGTGLIIFLLVRVIQRINRGPRIKTEPAEST